MYKIPLSVPSIEGNEWAYVKECLDTEWVSSAGKYVDLFEQKIAEYTSSKFAVACINGTSALQVSLKLAGVEPSDEVIVPTLTFIAPINTVAYNNARPIFMDSDDYYNIDIQKTIEFLKNETVFKNGYTYNKLTNNKISAIIAVHVWGNAVWLDELCGICDEKNIAIVEDASESLGSFYIDGNHKNNHTGSIGKLGCISFNGNKIITTGGGGMIITNDKKIAEKARYLTTQAKNDPINYIHNQIGYNFRLTNIQAALGVAQLEQLPKFLKKKTYINNFYNEHIKTIDGLSLAVTPKYSKNNFWMNILKINKNIYGENRVQCMERLKKNGIETRPIWYLNHLQKPFRNYQKYKIEKSLNQLDYSLCIPSSSNLTDEQLKFIISKLQK